MSAVGSFLTGLAGGVERGVDLSQEWFKLKEQRERAEKSDALKGLHTQWSDRLAGTDPITPADHAAHRDAMMNIYMKYGDWQGAAEADRVWGQNLLRKSMVSLQQLQQAVQSGDIAGANGIAKNWSRTSPLGMNFEIFKMGDQIIAKIDNGDGDPAYNVLGEEWFLKQFQMHTDSPEAYAQSAFEMMKWQRTENRSDAYLAIAERGQDLAESSDEWRRKDAREGRDLQRAGLAQADRQFNAEIGLRRDALRQEQRHNDLVFGLNVARFRDEQKFRALDFDLREAMHDLNDRRLKQEISEDDYRRSRDTVMDMANLAAANILGQSEEWKMAEKHADTLRDVAGHYHNLLAGMPGEEGMVIEPHPDGTPFAFRELWDISTTHGVPTGPRDLIPTAMRILAESVQGTPDGGRDIGMTPEEAMQRAAEVTIQRFRDAAEAEAEQKRVALEQQQADRAALNEQYQAGIGAGLPLPEGSGIHKSAEDQAVQQQGPEAVRGAIGAVGAALNPEWSTTIESLRQGAASLPAGPKKTKAEQIITRAENTTNRAEQLALIDEFHALISGR